ncbi:MAG: phosphatidate cytidylyltransferase [Candidatus Zixiibacteriota bacterium]
MRAFLIRLLVAIVAIPALLWIFHQGGWWLRGLVAVLIVLGVHEAGKLAQTLGGGFPVSLTAVIALAVPGSVLPESVPWVVWLVAVLLVAAAPAIWRRDASRAALGAAAQIIATIWIGLGFGAWVMLRDVGPAAGFSWLIFLFANLWIGDTAAYLFGVWLGKARLAPVISPNKTVAGAVAQVATSVVIGLFYVWREWIDAPAILVIAAAIMIAVVGQIGDLFESIWKRAAGVKDSSALIPGHGGVLDRFDSALFAAPGLLAFLRLWGISG